MTIKLYDFYADWCGPCKTQEPIIDNLKEEYEDNEDVIIKKINIEDNDELANEYAVRSLPTVVIVREHEDKEETENIDRFVGVTQKDTIETSIDNMLENY